MSGIKLLVVVLTLVAVIWVLAYYYKSSVLRSCSTYMYDLVVVAIGKDERCAAREWALHHIKQGVQYFYIIDNGSSIKDDDWAQDLRGLPVTVRRDTSRHQQTNLYNMHFLETVRFSAKFVMVIDFDEFVYARKEETITSILKKLPHNVGVLSLRWKMFGSNWHITQPSSIIHGFTRRMAMGANPRFDSIKSITRTSMLHRFEVHTHVTASCEIHLHPPHSTEESLKTASLQLNHYAIQSREFFNAVKKTRGDVSDKKSEHVRDQSYFDAYDVNDIIDEELSEITKTAQFELRLPSKFGESVEQRRPVKTNTNSLLEPLDLHFLKCNL